MPEPSGADRRRYIRFSPPIQVEVEVPRKLLGAVGMRRTVVARLMDLCEGGAGVFIPEAVEKGTAVRLKIRFEELNDSLEIPGVVMRSVGPPPVANAKDWILGIEFTQITREIEKKIATWRDHVTSTLVRKKTDERRKELGLDPSDPTGIR